MARTGMNYTKAALELDRQEAAERATAFDPARFTVRVPDLDKLTQAQQAADRFAARYDQIRQAAERATAFAIRFTPPS